MSAIGTRLVRLVASGRERIPAHVALARVGSWGVADQTVQSVGNFLALVTVARAASQEDFGLFSLALTAVMFQVTLASAILNQPFAILAPSRAGEGYARYVTAVLLAEVALGAVAALPILLAAGLAAAGGRSYAGLLVALAPAALATQIQEFVRQVLYVEGRARDAFWTDVVNYGGLVAGIVLLAAMQAVTPGRALTVMAVTSAAAGSIGLVRLRASICRTLTRRELRAANVETWRLGRWTSGVAVLSLSSTHLTPFVLGAASGVAAAGALRAMITVMGPVNIVFRTIGTGLIPAAARAFDREGHGGLAALMLRAALLAMLPVVVYGASVAAFAGPVLSFLYGDVYATTAWLMPVVALSFVIGAASALLDAAVRAQRIAVTPFRAAAVSFLVFWLVCAPAIPVYGLPAACVTLLAQPIIAVVLLVARLQREARRHAGRTVVGLL